MSPKYLLLRLFRAGNKTITDGILSARDFRAMLDRECARADRIGHPFALVVFEARSLNGQDRRVERLIGVAGQRKRSSDQIGWYEPGQIGIFLPDTSAGGAWRFVEDVRWQSPTHVSELPCRVYTYPHVNAGKDVGPKHFGRKDSQSGYSGRKRSSFKSRLQTAIFPRAEKGSEPLIPPEARHIPSWKRALDIAGALLGLVVLSPLFLLIAAIIKLVSPGPVFFRQERVGHLGRSFNMLKFRTMKVDASASPHKEHLDMLINSDKPMTKLDSRHDPRIIPLGLFLRKSCIDELPQLINVLCGEMSLVGPRPCMPYEAEKYLQWQIRRFDVLPGLTGLWQVSGKNKTTFLQMMQMDIGYSRRLSFWSEIKIVAKTIPAILHQFSHKSEADERREDSKAGQTREIVTPRE